MKLSHIGAVLAASAATAGALPAAAWAALGPGDVPQGAVRLSDELKLSRWAHAVSLAPIRATPSSNGARIGTLRLQMESDRAEIYLVLHSFRDTGGRTWMRIRVPGRPNGRVGWVSRSALGDLRRTELAIEVQRARRRVLVRRAGRVVMTARIGIGKRGTPTPAGRFIIRERFKVPAGTLYGVRALGSSAYAPYLTDWPLGGIIGFHGTDQPELIPGRPSNGCIRLRNKDVLRFYRIVRIGTPIHIR